MTETNMQAIDDAKFFAGVREKLFNGTLKQSQVDGMNAILGVWREEGLTDLRWLAYMLGTTFWETAKTMQPISEYGGPQYFADMYDPEGSRPGVAKMLGNTEPGDGALFHGRGFVQLTGRANYERMGRLLGIALVEYPELAKDAVNAGRIMFEGMLKADSDFGDFTGHCLEQYFNDKTENWIGARAIINGTDKAEVIAEIAKKFHAVLLASMHEEALAEVAGDEPTDLA